MCGWFGISRRVYRSRSIDVLCVCVRVCVEFRFSFSFILANRLYQTAFCLYWRTSINNANVYAPNEIDEQYTENQSQCVCVCVWRFNECCDQCRSRCNSERIIVYDTHTKTQIECSLFSLSLHCYIMSTWWKTNRMRMKMLLYSTVRGWRRGRRRRNSKSHTMNIHKYTDIIPTDTHREWRNNTKIYQIQQRTTLLSTRIRREKTVPQTV